jgi:hypothetical protein
MNFILMILLPFHSNAQESFLLRFMPVFNETHVVSTPCMLVSEGADTILLTEFQFYLHDIRLYSNGVEFFSSANNHFLMDAKDARSMSIEFPVSQKDDLDEISFMIGVDSLMQSSGAHSGALDPIWGMYWTWQSGYINWKLEAEYKGEEKKDSITWHVGGYRLPFNTIRCVKLPVIKNDAGELIIEFELEQLLSVKNRAKDSTIMSPSKQAMTLADVFQTCFKCKNR